MKISRMLAAVSAFVFLASQMASAEDSTDFARKMGSLLAAEGPCGLSYDQKAISAFIEKSVKPTIWNSAQT